MFKMQKPRLRLCQGVRCQGKPRTPATRFCGETRRNELLFAVPASPFNLSCCANSTLKYEHNFNKQQSYYHLLRHVCVYPVSPGKHKCCAGTYSSVSPCKSSPEYSGMDILVERRKTALISKKKKTNALPLHLSAPHPTYFVAFCFRAVQRHDTAKADVSRLTPVISDYPIFPRQLSISANLLSLFAIFRYGGQTDCTPPLCPEKYLDDLTPDQRTLLLYNVNLMLLLAKLEGRQYLEAYLHCVVYLPRRLKDITKTTGFEETYHSNCG
eukprot:284818378_3